MMDEINIPSDSRTIQDDIIDAYRAARDEVVRLEIALKFSGNWRAALKNFTAAFDRLYKDTRYNKQMRDNKIVVESREWIIRLYPNDEAALMEYVKEGVLIFEKYHEALDNAGLLPINKKG